MNQPQTEAELAALRHSIQRGVPYGEPTWRDKMVAKLGLRARPDLAAGLERATKVPDTFVPHITRPM